MPSQNSHRVQQSAPSSVPAGSWRLVSGQALSLHPRTAGELWIRQGRAWATLDGLQDGRGAGDHILQAGEHLKVPRGRHLVIESLACGTSGFEWVPASTASPAQIPRESLWLPLRDLWTAARLAGSALARLLRGLAAYPAIALVAACRGLGRQ